MNEASRAEPHDETTAESDAQARALAHLQMISVRAMASNLRRVTELDEALRLLMHGELSESQRTSAVETAHQLVGSAGTFGYERVSVAARRIEAFFADVPIDDELAVRAAADELAQIRQDLGGAPDEDFESD